jgi:trehalose synthase
VVLHDPGALGAAAAAPGTVLWRCHVDASAPDAPAWERAREAAEACRALVFADASFAPPGATEGSVVVAAPGIDPLGPRNLELAPRLAGRVLRQLGLDTGRPMICQAMRFDRWKDPHQAIEAFELVKAEHPELQLVLAGALDSGEGDGWGAFKEITDYADGQDDLHVLTSYSGLGNLELGALQQLARVALRLSLREGFGLATSEALWKGTPVVGNGGGMPLQARDGVDGFVADGAKETADRVLELLADPGLAIEMGMSGRERVRERFLVTRALEDELRVLAAVAAGAGDTLESR